MSEPKDINAPDYGQLAQAPAPGPPFLRVSRGAWLTADVALELHQAADRAGNPLVRFSIYLQPGTVLSSKGDTDTVLAEAAQATVFLDPAHLASIAWTAVRSRGGRCKRGPLRVVSQMNRRALLTVDMTKGGAK